MTCYVTGAGVDYDPKQQATAELIDNMSINYQARRKQNPSGQAL